MAKGGSISAADSFADLRYNLGPTGTGLTTISSPLRTEKTLVYSVEPLRAGSAVDLKFTGLNLLGQDFREQTAQEILTHNHPCYCWAWAMTADQKYAWTFGPYAIGWHRLDNLSLSWIQEENFFDEGVLTSIPPTEEITMNFTFEILQPSGRPHTLFSLTSPTLGTRVLSDQEYAAEFAATWFPITLNFGWPPTFLPTHNVISPTDLNVKVNYTLPGAPGQDQGLTYTALTVTQGP